MSENTTGRFGVVSPPRGRATPHEVRQMAKMVNENHGKFIGDTLSLATSRLCRNKAQAMRNRIASYLGEKISLFESCTWEDSPNGSRTEEWYYAIRRKDISG